MRRLPNWNSIESPRRQARRFLQRLATCAAGMGAQLSEAATLTANKTVSNVYPRPSAWDVLLGPRAGCGSALSIV